MDFTTFKKGIMSIKPKEKPCKGIDTAKGLGCGKPTIHRKKGLGLMCGCWADFLLNTDAGKLILNAATLKASKPRLEEEKNKQELAEAEKFKKDRQKLSYLLINVRNICHAYIRKRDQFKPCISCGVPYNTNFQAGHFYKAEKFSNLKFNETNIHGQCEQCNLYKDGNESGYRSGLIQRYGLQYVNEIDKQASSYKQNSFHWERDHLEEIRRYYKSKSI